MYSYYLWQIILFTWIKRSDVYEFMQAYVYINNRMYVICLWSMTEQYIVLLLCNTVLYNENKLACCLVTGEMYLGQCLQHYILSLVHHNTYWGITSGGCHSEPCSAKLQSNLIKHQDTRKIRLDSLYSQWSFHKWISVMLPARSCHYTSLYSPPAPCCGLCKCPVPTVCL